MQFSKGILEKGEDGNENTRGKITRVMLITNHLETTCCKLMKVDFYAMDLFIALILVPLLIIGFMGQQFCSFFYHFTNE